MITKVTPVPRARFSRAILLFAFVLWATSQADVANATKRALLVEGKTLLHQRILSRPNAALSPNPGETAEGDTLVPFTPFYVFDRVDLDGMPWLLVGPAVEGDTVGWVPDSAAIEWNHTISVAFTVPSGRTRLPFFRDRATLEEIIVGEDVVERLTETVNTLETGFVGDDYPAVALEPPVFVDIETDFYLLPVLDFESTLMYEGYEIRMLEVASVSAEEETAQSQPTQQTRQNPLQVHPATAPPPVASIAFVIDTTSSMGPYIELTREVVRTVATKLQAHGLDQLAKLAVVGFRDNTQITPELDYVSKTFVDFSDNVFPADFQRATSPIQAADISSHGFEEDVYSGVRDAINALSWDQESFRYVIVISDAGPRVQGDPLAGTGLSSRDVNQLANDNHTAVFVIHLLTGAGKANHASAQAEFLQLANFSGRSTYYSVDAGDLNDFGNTLDLLSQTLIKSIQASNSPITAAYSAPGPTGQQPATQAGSGTAQGTQQPTQKQTQLIQNAYAVGHAMHLIYLGRQEGTPPPPLFHAWVPDRDLTDPSAKALDVRLLLNRQQLSDLQETLKAILKAGQLGQINPDDFFAQLQSASALMARQARNVSQAQLNTIGDIDVLQEYLGGLPYTSQIMNVTQRDWSGMSIAGQQEILDNLLSKIRLYREYHDDTDKWQDFDGRLPDAEALYPIPLDALP